MHLKNFLVKPLFNITQDVPDHFLHCDTTKNILVLVTVEFKDKALIIKTLSSLKTGLRQKITIYDSSSHQSDDTTEMYRSNFFNCKGLGDNSEGLSIPITLIEQCRQLLCRMEFDLVGHKVQRIDIPELGVVRKAFVDESGLAKVSYSWKERRKLPENIPRIRRDEVFERFSRTHVLSDDHTEIITVDSKECIPIICSVCQTFLIVLQYTHSSRMCDLIICRKCRFPNILMKTDGCSNNGHWNAIKSNSALSQYHKLNFYCKFNCGEYFRSKELLKHQDICDLNKNKGLTDEEKIARYFGVKMDKNRDRLYQHNDILIYRNLLSKQGKIYVVKKDDILFIVDYTFENNTFAYKVVHEYDNVNVFIKYYWVGGSRCQTTEDIHVIQFAFPEEIPAAVIVVILQKR